MVSSPGSRTAGSTASPPAVSRPCGPQSASAEAIFLACSARFKPLSPPETSAGMSIPGEELHSAAVWPQPMVATPWRSGFDLRRQDLQPDEQVNHRDGQQGSHEEFPRTARG